MRADTDGPDPKLLSEIIRLSYQIRQARSVLAHGLARLYVLSQLHGLISQDRGATRKRRHSRFLS